MATLSFNADRQIELYRRGAERAAASIPFDYETLRQRARAELDHRAFTFVDGGAGREQTIAANRAAFDRWAIVPRMLGDVTTRDLSIELFGRTYATPLMAAPIGVQGEMHELGEVATATGAARAGAAMVLSTVSSQTMEAVAEAMGDAPRWFQLYWPGDAELTRSFLRRAEASGYEAIVVTLDTRMLAWRPRDLANAHLPFLLGKGLANYTSDPVFRASLPVAPEHDMGPAIERFLRVFSDLSQTWSDLRFIREHTDLPVIVKGIQHADDVSRALDNGADGIVVSNHGGRQVDGAIGSLAALPGVVEAADGRVPVLFDSGVRCAADAFKAIALGAAAVLIGRPYMYALALDGADGVAELFAHFHTELELTMSLCGCSHVSQIDRGLLAEQG